MTADLLDRLESELRPEAIRSAMASLVVLAALGGYLYVLKPSLVELRKLRRANAAARLEAASDRAALGDATIATLEAQVKDARERLYGVSSEVPLTQMESWIINRLHGISRQRSVELGAVTPGEVGTVLMFDEMPYDIEVSGSYFDLYEWLQDVERELRPMIVKQFELRPERGSKRVSMKLRLVSYRPQGGTR